MEARRQRRQAPSVTIQEHDMEPVKVELLPQSHKDNDAKFSSVDPKALKSQIKIARHLLKNRDAFIFVEGAPPNLPAALSPRRYRACSARRYDSRRCGFKSLWRSIRASKIYFSKFNVRKDLMSDGAGPLLKDRGFQRSITDLGAPAFLFFLGAVKYVIFADNPRLLDQVPKEYKRLEPFFGSLSGCFMAVPKSRLYKAKFTNRERHVLKVVDQFASRFPKKKRILVFGGLHNFPRYNGARFRFEVPKTFAPETAYAKRTSKELADSCADMVVHSIGLGIVEFVEWFKNILKGFLQA